MAGLGLALGEVSSEDGHVLCQSTWLQSRLTQLLARLPTKVQIREGQMVAPGLGSLAHTHAHTHETQMQSWALDLGQPDRSHCRLLWNEPTGRRSLSLLKKMKVNEKGCLPTDIIPK